MAGVVAVVAAAGLVVAASPGTHILGTQSGSGGGSGMMGGYGGGGMMGGNQAGYGSGYGGCNNYDWNQSYEWGNDGCPCR